MGLQELCGHPNIACEILSKSAFSVGGDLVSRYIWRGADYGNSPAIQPAVAFSVAGFKIGSWGSYGLGQYSKEINDTTIVNMGHYAEFDLYVSYTWKGFTVMAYDYFFPNGLNPNTGNKFYNFNNATTGHTLEACLSWAGPEKFPLQLFAGTFVYGADKGKDSCMEPEAKTITRPILKPRTPSMSKGLA